jgi:hypothetical protein
MTEEKETPNSRELAELLHVLGPEEDWDDTATALVLELHGIDSDEAPSRLAKLIDREIESRRERGEEVPPGFEEVRSRLASDSKGKEGVRRAKDQIEEMFIGGKVPIDSASSQVHKTFHRRTKKLSEKDEEILKELSDELMADDQGEQ